MDYTEQDECAMAAAAYPLLIKQLLLTPLAHKTRNEIVYRDCLRYDYPTFRERIGRLGSALSNLGVTRGKTVAVMDWDSHRYLECFFAIPMLGAVIQTVNIRLSPDDVAYTLNHAGADILLCNSEFLPILAKIRPLLRTVTQFVCLDDDGHVPADFPGNLEYEQLLRAADPQREFPEFDEHTRATTFYTTGTTGRPKGVYFSHRQIVLHTLAVTASMALGDGHSHWSHDDVYMPITPMFHAHAWGHPYVATLAGCKQVYPGRYETPLLLRLLKQEKVTRSHCVPTILHMLLTHPDAEQVDFSGWSVLVGGAALPGGLAQNATDRGINILAGYGMSETGPTLTLSRVQPERCRSAEDRLKQRIRPGLPIPLVELRVVDNEMRDVPHDGRSAGEVVARAPWLTTGYLHNPDASEALWQGGYLHTSDIGSIDADGYLCLTDRLKDVIKSGGEWISSIQLEDLIGRHASVSEVAVIGIRDEQWGERPLALVVRKPAADTTEETLRQHLLAAVGSGLMPKYAIPKEIRFVDALARTSVGKLDKVALRKQHASA